MDVEEAMVFARQIQNPLFIVSRPVLYRQAAKALADEVQRLRDYNNPSSSRYTVITDVGRAALDQVSRSHHSDTAVVVCPECDIAGCRHIRGREGQ